MCINCQTPFQIREDGQSFSNMLASGKCSKTNKESKQLFHLCVVTGGLQGPLGV